MKLGSNLTHLCKLKGWSMKRLAREAGIPSSTLAAWSAGRKPINLEQLKKVSTALEVSLHQLVFGSPDPFEPGAEELLKEIFTGDVRISIHRIERKKGKI